MKPFSQRYPAGQIQGAWFKRASALVAVDGTVRLTYRDASLDWMLDVAPKVSVLVRPGERHVMPFEAFVEVSAEGPYAVNALIEPAARRPLLLARIRRALIALGVMSAVPLRRG